MLVDAACAGKERGSGSVGVPSRASLFCAARAGPRSAPLLRVLGWEGSGRPESRRTAAPTNAGFAFIGVAGARKRRILINWPTTAHKAGQLRGFNVTPASCVIPSAQRRLTAAC